MESDSNNSNNEIDESILSSISNLTISPNVETATNTTTSTATTTSTPRSTIATTKPKKELKNLVLYKLIDLENAKCYVKYKDTKKDIELILNEAGEPSFKLASADNENQFLIEQSATTLLKSYLKADSKTAIKGNSYVYINDKKIDDYSFDEFVTPKKTPSDTTTTSIQQTPGIDQTPYREINNNNRISKKEIKEIEEEYEFFKRDPNMAVENIKYEEDGVGLNIEEAKIKASGIGRFFHFGCERYLSYSTRQKSYNDDDSIKKIQSPISIVQQKLIDEGFNWENKVLLNLEENSNERIFKPINGKSDITIEETIRILKEEKGNFYMIQSTLEPPKSFTRNLPDSIKFSISKPDFLYIKTDSVSGIREIEIQDAKSTTSILFHQKIQLAFYYLLLNEIIKVFEIKDLKVSNRGGIYLKGDYNVEYFSLVDSVRILESFLFGNLIKKQSYLLDILMVPKELSPWILSERCDGCEFINHCSDQLSKDKSLNTSVNIKTSSLLNLIKESKQHEQQNEDSSDLEFLLNQVDKESIKNVSQKIDYIKSLPMIEATLKDKIIPTRLFDIKLSSYEDIQVYLEIIHDPMNQSVYQWGVLLVEESQGQPKFAKGNDFMDMVMGLSVIFNQFHKSKKSLQCYIFDSFQKSLFFKQCFKKLKEINSNRPNNDEEINKSNQLYKESILLVLRTLLNSNEWINLNIAHYPQCNVPSGWSLSERQDEYTILIIQDLIKTSFAINVKPFYTFENIVQKLLLPEEKESTPLTSSDELFKLIINGNDVYEIIENRLHQQIKMIKLLKQQVFNSNNGNGSMVKPAQPFLIREISKYNDNKYLAKLFYCYQNECISSYRKLKNSRSNPLEINLLDGTFTKLKLSSIEDKSEKKFRLTFTGDVNLQNYPRFEYNLDKSFSSFCLIDIRNINSLWNLNEILQTTFSNPLIEQIQSIQQFYIEDHNENYVSLSLVFDVASNSKFSNNISKEFILFEKYDIGYFSMHRSLLKSYDDMDKNGSVFLDILNNPIEWCKENIDLDFERLSLEVVESFRDVNGHNPKTKLTMTKSQENIYNSILKKRLTLVRGPPGTGKTHFLALVVLIFMECYKRKQTPFRIVITSFTHNAIDNLLLRIAALMKEYSISVGQDINFPLFKKQSKISDDLKDAGVRVFDAKKDINSRDHFCLGATSWSLSTLDYNDFDLLIIDEASQLSSYIGVMPFQRLNKLNGKVIVCGDNKQLGPVLNDIYPNKKQLNCSGSGGGDNSSSNPKLQKSIFSCIKSHLISNGIETPFLSLYENFRMNSQLCEFSQTLYGKQYQCFKEDQEKITPLLIDNFDLNNQLIESIFNNDQSCHTILLDDSQFGDKNLEAQIVKQIYRFLRKEYSKRPSIIIEDTNGKILTDDALLEDKFWRKDLILGVITPLHIQRNTIIPMINRVQINEFKLTEPVKPIVNTVEVTQGKEFENVILCYNGFDDFNRISEFSFDLNRLNVGFTRSKKRFILIVSSKLFFPDESIFDNKRMSLAYNHLIKYIEYSKIHKFYPQQTAINNVIKLEEDEVNSENNLIDQFKNLSTTTPSLDQIYNIKKEIIDQN